MYACLAFQIAVGVLPLDSDRRGLHPCFTAFQYVKDVDLEAVSLRPAGIHTVEHLVPVLGLGAAGSGVEIEDSVVLIVLAGEQRSQRQSIHLVGERGKLRLDVGDHAFVVFLGSHIEHYLDVLGGLCELAVLFKSRLEGTGLLEDLLRVFEIVPEAGLGGLVMQLFNALL